MLITITIMCYIVIMWLSCFFFQAEDGIRDLVRSRGLGDVYKRQVEEERKNHTANWQIPIIRTVAIRGEGMKEVAVALLSLIHI